MSAEEFAREMKDLERLAPPPSDPIALFERDTLIADLQQENNELRQTIASRDMQISALAKNVGELEQQIATVEGKCLSA